MGMGAAVIVGHVVPVGGSLRRVFSCDFGDFGVVRLFSFSFRVEEKPRSVIVSSIPAGCTVHVKVITLNMVK